MARRQATPWDSISPTRFMHDVIRDADGPTAEATLCVRRRNDVQTRRWYTLAWTGGDGKQHHVEASDLTLLMERAPGVPPRPRADAEAEWGD